VGWVWPSHLSGAKTDSTHDAHGHWLDLVTMLINLATACRMNSTCSDHKGGDEEEEEKKEGECLLY